MGGHHNRNQRIGREPRRPAERPVLVELTVDELAIVTRTIVGLGGMQGFLLRLVPRITKDRRLVLAPNEVAQIRRYATDYGPGGYEDRFRAIVAAIERELDTRGNRS